MEEKDFWIAFSVFPGVGPVTFQKLLDYFSSAKKAWEGSKEELQLICGEKKVAAFCLFRQSFSFEQYKQKLENAKVSVVTLEDSQYPLALKKGKNAPFVLYAKGNIALLQETQTIGVVGTRKITQYGRDVTALFTETLVRANCTIVSGLAMGVDAVAHKTAIDNGGKTIAVLGCGVDCCYPQENQKLYEDILDCGGLVLSEVPLGMSPNKGTFPARNRIVAGLSQGMLVTEGAEDSGALITASDSLKLNRPVFAVPGPITSSLSKGSYKLIAQGATLVTTPEDMLHELGIKNQESRISKQKIKGDSEAEQMIIDLLAHEPLGFDELVRSTKIDSQTLASLVSLMEIKGMLVSTNGTFSLAITFAY